MQHRPPCPDTVNGILFWQAERRQNVEEKLQNRSVRCTQFFFIWLWDAKHGAVYPRMLMSESPIRVADGDYRILRRAADAGVYQSVP